MLNRLLIITSLAGLTLTSCQQDSKQPSTEYPYEFVEGDPMGARIYRLKNGLTVNLAINKDEPRVQTQIAVRAGSKNDPSDATGLAHYLEHMVFKGTSKIATSNWEKEQPLLDQISDLYEEHRNTTDSAQRSNIYRKIDSISTIAAQIAIPNEYDKMISSLGAKGTNAYTSTEQTVYINNIPSTELEKWMMVESERFSELVLRLFHTELEAVYEEYNRGLDNDYWKVYHKLDELLYLKHPYGTQTTIGTGEHLKNPSMVKIHEFFNTYYAPNNMCISIAGDLDFDKTIAMVDQHFGKMKAKDIPAFTFTPEDPITEPREASVYGPSPEMLNIAFLGGGAETKDGLYFALIDLILNNSQAGLIDLNLAQKQKVIRPGSSYERQKDYSTFYLRGMPRDGQTLDEVQTLLLEQLELVKKGEFEDWMIDAVINDIQLSELRRNESNWGLAATMTEAFILGINWKDAVNEIEELKKLTKQDIVDFANRTFKNNYVAVKKLTGKDPNAKKVNKPSITQLEINRDTTSGFAQKLEKIKSLRLDPLFVDYEKEIATNKLQNGIELNSVANKTNELFSLSYILDMGSYHDKKMTLAIKYLPYLGTSKYSPEEIQKEFYKLGLSFDVYPSTERTYVSLDGLQKNMKEGVKLFEHLLNEVIPNEESLPNLIADILKQRADAKLNKRSILNGGMVNYAKYGNDSPFKNRLSEDEMKAIKAEELIEKIKSISSYKHKIFYYGNKPAGEVVAVLNELHQTPDVLLDYPEPVAFDRAETDKNRVLFVDYDMVQNEVMMISKGQQFNKTLMPQTSIFNEYFGAGLSSIVFQEIREAKALAYSARCYFINPSKKEDPHYVQAYIGTQSDKLGDAIAAMTELMNNMPEAPDQFEDSRISALKKIETDRITKASIFWNRERLTKLGINSDVRKEKYEAIQKMSIADIKTFFENNIKERFYTYIIIGKKENTDIELLKSLGEYKELTLEEIFGY